jgi:LPS-assembly protein
MPLTRLALIFTGRVAAQSVILSMVLIASAWSALGQTASPAPTRPIHLQADTLTYDKTTQTYHGSGHVILVQGPLRLDADDATLNVSSGQMTAVGNVHLLDGQRDLHADRLDLNINTSKGVIFHGRIFVLEGGFTLDGRVLERLSEDQYRIEDGSFTTCSAVEGGRLPWQFKADHAQLDVDGYLYARNARFCILDIPVLYLPVVVFPAKRERATGLLFPSVGAGSKQGFKIRQALFWEISPSQDATFAVDYRGKLGVGGDFEYRYILSKDSAGRLFTKYFRDTQSRVGRVDVFYRHLTKFSEDLQGRIDINYLNQENNLSVLSENVLQRVAVFQESQAYLTRRWDNQVLYGLTRYSQNLTFSDKTTLQTLPEIGYSILPLRLGSLPLYGSINTVVDNFYRQEGLDARRAVLFPRVWSPLSLGRYGTITPMLGFLETFYSRRISSEDSTSREALYFSTLFDTRLTRRFQPKGTVGILHKVEPALIYEYLPGTRQSDIPVFNDLDRLLKKNLITYRVTNRLSTKVFDGETFQNVEFAYLRLTQSEHLGSSPTGKPFSDLRSELILRTIKPIPITVDIDTFYNHYESAVVQVNTDITLELTHRYYFTVSERFTRAGTVPIRGDIFNPLSLNEQMLQTQTIHFYAAQFGAALPYNFYFVTRGYYDKKEGVFPEINYGLYYVGSNGCWGVGAFYIQRPGQASEYAFVLTLGGVGYTDSPFSALYRSLFSRLGLDIQKLR